MAKKNNPAPVESAVDAGADAVGEHAASVDAGGGPKEEAVADGGDAGAPAEVDGSEHQGTSTEESASGAPPPVDELDIPSGDTVPALVLSDNHLGKVGQVIQVNATHAEALRVGGLVDTHPNAIESATAED